MLIHNLLFEIMLSFWLHTDGFGLKKQKKKQQQRQKKPQQRQTTTPPSLAN